MKKSNIDALLRELRSEAKALPAGKRRDVLSKLDRIDLQFRRAGSAPASETVPEEEGERLLNQTRTIYNYMVTGHTITSMDALRLFGVARLASRICDISRKMGVTPSRRRIQVTNRHGKEVYVNEYWIETE